MTQDVIPPRLTPEEIAQLGQYNCPLCRVQSPSDEADTGWVYCPMLDNKAICLGCCIDHQSVARSEEFDKHLYRGLFDDVALMTGKSTADLRLICLQHQEEILENRTT